MRKDGMRGATATLRSSKRKRPAGGPAGRSKRM